MINSLQTTNQNQLQRFISTLSPYERQVVELYSQKNIRAVDSTSLKRVLNDAISICYFDLGLKKPITDDDLKNRVEDILTLINSVLQELNSDPFYYSLRVPEIGKAIKNGSLGKYNDAKWSFIGISTANIITSIRKYIEDVAREKDIAQYMKLISKSETTKPPTEAEIKQMVTDNIIRSYSVFKKVGWFDDPGNMIYRELHKLGHLNFEDSIIKGFYFKAKDRLLRQYDYRNILEKFKRAEFKRRFEALADLKGAEILNDSEIQIEVCRVALNHFFSQVSEMDMPIEDILATD